MIQKILQDKFIKDNVVFFIGSIIIAVFNYLYHPVMSRMMSVEDFGEVQALISLTYITSIFLIIIGTIAVNIISNKKNDAIEKNIPTLSQLYKLSLYVVGVFAVGIIALSPYLMQVLQFESMTSFFPLALILIVGVPFVFYSSYLRGVRQFGAVSIAGIIASAGKLIFASIFVLLGFGVFGAIGALAIATFVALLYTLYKTRGIFRLTLKNKLVFTPQLRKELKYGILIFVSLGYITFLYTSDVLFVKHFFDPHIAGLYSGIATIARIIFFATASVSGVLLPSIKLNATKKQNKTILKKAVIIITLLGIGIMGMFMLFTEQIILILMGEAYLSLINLLPIAGVYIFMASLTNMMYVYFLALRDKRLIYISIIGFITTVILITLNHDSLLAVVTDYIIGITVTMSILGVSFLSKNKPFFKPFSKNIAKHAKLS